MADKANNVYFTGRNAANTADIDILAVVSNDNTVIQANAGQLIAARIGGSDVAYFRSTGIHMPAGHSIVQTLDLHGSAGVGSSETLSALYHSHKIILDANVTITFTAPTLTGSQEMVVDTVQNGTGGWTITWPTSVDWPGGVVPTPSTAPNARDKYVFTTIDSGATWDGHMVGKGYA